MPRGLGTAQRLMLFRLADHELRLAEAAQERQLPYRSPDRWSLRWLTYSTFYTQVTAGQRAQYEAWQGTLRRMKAGDKEALDHVAFLVNISGRLRRPGPDLDPSDFEPEWPGDRELQRFNPSRAIIGLERRGFVERNHYSRFDNLALTPEGFAEARRLGGVRQSEIVDLDRVQANWRAVENFALGYRGPLWRDDGRPEDVVAEHGYPSLVVGKFDHLTE
jgi:hypothetical protein